MLTLIVTVQCSLLQFNAALQTHVLEFLNKVVPIVLKVQLTDHKADNLLIGTGFDIANGRSIFVTLAVKLSRVGIS